MKPNGKYFPTRLVILALCALGSLTTLASAESLHGNFKLTAEAHWGRLLLTPGEYDFSMSQDSAGYVVTVRSQETGWSGMVMSDAVSEERSTEATELVLTKSESGMYVRELRLAGAGITLNYTRANRGKLTRLTKAPAANLTVASASGAQ